MSRVVTIAHVIPSFGMGGQQRRIAALVDGLGPQWRHLAFALDGDTSAIGLVGARERIVVRPLVIAKSRGINLRNLRRLRDSIRGADILCTYNWGSLEAALANRLAPRLPHIHYEDGFGPEEAGGLLLRRRILARRLLLAGTIVATPSEAMRAVAIDQWRLPHANVRRLPLGVDLERFSCARDHQRSPVAVGAVGALRAEKNFARLIRACARAGIERLEIVGDGPERRALEAIAGPGVSLPGATDRADLALRRFDIFALSSDTEQAPISIMEAMASGLPVVAPDVGDIKAMVSGENVSAITPRGDEEALAAQLRRLAADPLLRRAMGEANARVAHERYGAAAMVEANRRLFEAAIAADEA